MKMLIIGALCVVALFFAVLLWCMLKVAAKADDLAESWEKARREQIEKAD